MLGAAVFLLEKGSGPTFGIGPCSCCDVFAERRISILGADVQIDRGVLP
jgi:hypothetical protein